MQMRSTNHRVFSRDFGAAAECSNAAPHEHNSLRTQII